MKTEATDLPDFCRTTFALRWLACTVPGPCWME